MQWDYLEREGVERASYRGLVIDAERDSDARNPWEDWDGNPALAVAYGRNGIREYGEPLDALANISDSLFRRHWRAICKAVDADADELHAEAVESQRDYGGARTDIKRELVGDRLEELKPSTYGGNAGDYFQAVADLWAIAGREALATSSQGYSQGDYADLLLVATPAWEKETGAPRDSHKRQLEASADLWGAWAWGDVYGYVIKAPGGADLDELHDSCWGFYGTNHNESGLEEQAANAADCIIASVRRKRQETLKRLIRARVPLAIREELLADVTGALAPLFTGKESD